MAIRQQTDGLAEIAELLNIMKRNLRGLPLFTGRVPASFSFYLDSDKPDYEKLSITVLGATTRTVTKSIKRRKRTERWRGDEMKIRMEEDILSGTGAEIMDHLRARVFDPTEFPDTESYIWFLRNNVVRTTGLDFPLPEGDVEQQARMMFTQLAKVGALTILED